MANLKISDLTELSETDGSEYAEVIIPPFTPGTNRKVLTAKIGLTREFERAWSSEILFDKNEIAYEQHELTGNLEYTVASSGNLTDQFSSATQIIETDGTRTVTFTGFNFVLGDIQSGAMPDTGTYLVLFLYFNGIKVVNWTEPSLEVANLTPLSAPANFAAVPGAGDPETEVDLTWTAVANAASYHIDYSLDGVAWVSLTDPASGATSYTHSALLAGTQYYYRIRAIGDMVAFSNSAYSTATTTTEDSGDVTAPTFTFLPADAATGIPMNRVMIITASAPIRDQDGTTVITNANVTNYLTVKEDNGAGANIPYTATINAGKTIITITPNVVYPALDNVFVEIDGVEGSVNSVHAATADATFASSDYTEMNGNYLNLDQQFNAIVTGNDIDFELEIELKDPVLSSYRGLFQKQTTAGNQHSWIWATDDDDVHFAFHATSGGSIATRTIIWPNALAGFTVGKLTLKYFGAIDTNNGLDRAALYKDDVLVTAGKNVVAAGTSTGFGTWPFAISASTSPLYISGPTYREARNAIIRNNSGATVQGNYPVIRTGEDTSGNNRDGSWI